MTAEDAQSFINQVMRSRDPRIADFRRMIEAKADQYRGRRRKPR